MQKLISILFLFTLLHFFNYSWRQSHTIKLKYLNFKFFGSTQVLYHYFFCGNRERLCKFRYENYKIKTKHKKHISYEKYFCLYQIINNDFYRLIFILHSRVTKIFLCKNGKKYYKNCWITVRKNSTKMNYMLARVCKWKCLKFILYFE